MSPPSGNTGGKSPVFIDWCRYSVRGPSFAVIAAHVADVNAEAVLTLRDKGWLGYTQSAVITVGGVEVGRVGLGGHTQRGAATIEWNGTGCALVDDFATIVAFCERNHGTLRRVDVSADYHDGSHTVEECIALFKAGEFCTGGKPPSARLVDDLGSGKGRTLYVGARAGSKFARFYEKGKQLGDVTSPWLRAEIEYKAADRFLPLDMLLVPGDYFAGAYPFLATWVDHVPRNVRADRNNNARPIEHAVQWARQQVGGVVNVLACKLGWQPISIVNVLFGPKPSARLLPVTAVLPPAMFPLTEAEAMAHLEEAAT